MHRSEDTSWCQKAAATLDRGDERRGRRVPGLANNTWGTIHGNDTREQTLITGTEGPSFSFDQWERRPFPLTAAIPFGHMSLSF